MTTDQSDEPANDLPVKLSNPARRALAGIGCTSLAQVAQHSEAAVKKLHGMGPSGIKLLHEALAAQGLSFASGKK
jgi:hypothetical protein